MQVESYIVRIYRRGRNGSLVGVVETATGGWQKPFCTIQELSTILATPKRRSRRVTQEPDVADDDEALESPAASSVPSQINK
jgi:hypothetical protein